MSTSGHNDFAHLLALRNRLRRFLHWSERQAEEAGITPAQHQLLLAIGADPSPHGPTIGEIAGHLMLRHNSAVGLVDRAVAAGLIERRRNPGNDRIVRLGLTEYGEDVLHRLADAHKEELVQLADTMSSLQETLTHGGETAGGPTREDPR